MRSPIAAAVVGRPQASPVSQTPSSSPVPSPAISVRSGSPFEKKAGYSRAVVEDEWVFVAGTTGFDYAAMTIVDDPAEQTRQALRNIEAALAEAGVSLADVVRVQYYLPDAADWPLIQAPASVPA